ncbi:MAG: hypothetical protein K1X64_19345 [Myxococcaceae bacterium]|nr:hypothetical protein [Myxococcaceae bacterium]
MKSVTVGTARAEISALLDAAERGERVVIRRRDASFRLVRETTAKKKRQRAVLAWADPVLLSDDWTWQWKGGQLVFRSRKGRRN